MNAIRAVKLNKNEAVVKVNCKYTCKRFYTCRYKEKDSLEAAALKKSMFLNSNNELRLIN